MSILSWIFGIRPNSPGIYRIRNKRNGKVYIGSTRRSIRIRLEEHISRLDSGTHPNYLLQLDWDAYGYKAFAFEIMENTDPLQTETRELYWQLRVPSNKSYMLKLAQPLWSKQQRKDDNEQLFNLLIDAAILLGWTDDDFVSIFKAKIAASAINRRDTIDMTDDTPIRMLREKL